VAGPVAREDGLSSWLLPGGWVVTPTVDNTMCDTANYKMAVLASPDLLLTNL
jgi:hypothetical protein